MNCPLCIDADLEPTFHHGIEVDVCPSCKGIWLDRGELDKLLSDAAPARPAATTHVRPDRKRYDDHREDSRHDDDRDHSYERVTSKKKGKKKKSKGQRLADLLDDVLDL